MLQDQITKEYDAVVFDVLRVNAEEIAVSICLSQVSPLQIFLFSVKSSIVSSSWFQSC